MIPAKTRCPSTWTLEYSGYLMSAYRGNDRHSTMYECVDKNPDSVPGSAANTWGALFHPVAMECCVHFMIVIHRKNSPVLFVPNRGHWNYIIMQLLSVIYSNSVYMLVPSGLFFTVCIQDI